MTNDFSLGCPAENVEAVLDVLHKEHMSHYVYRGQTKDYSSIIPSMYRRQSGPGQHGFTKVGVDGRFYGSKLENAKFELFRHLLSKYGIEVGNYISQQYLCHSECIDITSHPDIAAFFATRPYPFDEPLYQSGDLGVIFRFDARQITAFDSMHKNLDFNYISRIGHLIDDDSKIYKMYLEREQRNGWTAESFYFTPRQLERLRPPLTDRLLVTFPRVYNYADMCNLQDKNITESAANFLKSIGTDENRGPGIRAKVQQGGIIVSRRLWECQLPLWATADSMSSLYRYDGEKALRWMWTNRMIGVEDIYNKYGMRAFYFRHTGQTIDLSRNDVWPNWKHDDTFYQNWMLVSLSIDFNKKDYLPEDVIDIGFPENRPDCLD